VVGVVLVELEVAEVELEVMVMGFKPPSIPFPPPLKGRVPGYSLASLVEALNPSHYLLQAFKL